MNSRLVRGALLIVLCCAYSDATSAQEVYVPNFGNGDVSVLDADTQAPLARIPVTLLADPRLSIDGQPSAVVFSADRKLAFVALSNSSHVAVIDTTTRTVVDYIATLPVTFDAMIFLHPSGDRLYVTSCTDPAISVIDVATREMTGTIALPSGSYPMTFSQNGHIGYVGNGYDGCGAVNGLYRVNLSTNTLLGFIPTSGAVSDVAVSPAGRFALATGGRIVVVDLVANAESGAVMCGLAPCSYLFGGGIEFNAMGTRAYAVDYFANTLSTIDTDPSSTRYLHELSRVPVTATLNQGAWQVAVRQDRAYVIVLGFPGHMVTFDISTDTPVQLSVEPVGDYAYELDVMWTLPSSMDECKNDGWKTFKGFRNQGDCVSFVVSKGQN